MKNIKNKGTQKKELSLLLQVRWHKRTEHYDDDDDGGGGGGGGGI